MEYLGFTADDVIEVTTTYRCQMPRSLRSDIRYSTSWPAPGDYKVVEPYQATVVSETYNGIWIMKNGTKEFLEKDKYLFKKL